MFVVGADRGGVKPALHAFFEESSRAKHLLHRRIRRFLSGPIGGASRRASGCRGVIFDGHISVVGSLCRAFDLRPHRIHCRIGCTLRQKSAFTLPRRVGQTSYDNIPFPLSLTPSVARREATGSCISLDSGHLRTEQASSFCSASPLSHCVTLGSGDFERFPSRGQTQTNLSWGAT